MNINKEITKALLKNECIEAYIKSFSINLATDSIMEVDLTLLIPDNSQAELSNLVKGQMGKVAIVKL